MTAALFALCAVLAVALVREGYANIRANRKIEAMIENAARDGRLLQEAQRLLRDPRARGKNVKHSAWLTEVDLFTREWRGEV